MRLLFVMAVNICAWGLGAPAAEWTAGGENPVSVPHLPSPARVFLPENWTPDRKWPALFFYPGTAGKANIETMRQHTGGKDFIIVGMPNRDDRAFTYTPEAFGQEQSALREMRDKLAGEAHLDPKRVFVAGFSKGGWLACLLLAHEPGLAGGIVMGGGWVEHQHEPPRKFNPPVYIYVGDGRLDGNFPPALRASQELAKLGAHVTFDVWPETGHAIPPGGADGLRQWLALVARGAAARDEAAKWAEPELQRILTLREPVYRWYELRRFAQRPFTRALGEEWARRVAAKIADLEQQPAVAAEVALDRELSTIHQREIQDMKVTTLEAVGPRYEALAQKAPDTIAGRLAAHDAARIEKLWETVPGGKP